MVERLRPDEARRLLQQLLAANEFRYSPHASAEMAKDGLESRDCEHALRAGVVEEPERENGSWRYRVRTSQLCVVVAFPGRKRVIVVTAWRLNR